MLSKKEFKIIAEQIKEEKQAASTKNMSRNSILYSDLDGYSVISGIYEGVLEDEKTISGARNIIWYGTTDVENSNETYACSVVALCNLMKYYQLRGFDKISTSFTTLYSNLWRYALTLSNGHTSAMFIPLAAEKYIEELGYNCSFDEYLLNLYSDFTRDIKNDKPCMLSYRAKFGPKKDGHTVFVIGYVKTTAYQYLHVADGWNTYSRYLNYNGYDYSLKKGCSFKVD